MCPCMATLWRMERGRCVSARCLLLLHGGVPPAEKGRCGSASLLACAACLRSFPPPQRSCRGVALTQPFCCGVLPRGRQRQRREGGVPGQTAGVAERRALPRPAGKDACDARGPGCWVPAGAQRVRENWQRSTAQHSAAQHSVEAGIGTLLAAVSFKERHIWVSSCPALRWCNLPSCTRMSAIPRCTLPSHPTHGCTRRPAYIICQPAVASAVRCACSSTPHPLLLP